MSRYRFLSFLVWMITIMIAIMAWGLIFALAAQLL